MKALKFVLWLVVIISLMFIGNKLSDYFNRVEQQEKICVRLIPRTDESQTETRSILRHPLIPGGVKTLADLRAAVNSNPRLKAFYEASGFDFSCAQQKQLTENEWADVTYRRQKDIVWSSTPVLLLAGETVFEDCHEHVIRAQCGNLIASVKTAESLETGDLVPGSLSQVFPDTPDTPLTPDSPPISAPPGPPTLPVAPIPPEYGPTPLYGFLCCGGGIITQPPGPVPAPEPNPRVLAIFGVAILAAKLISDHYRMRPRQ